MIPSPIGVAPQPCFFPRSERPWCWSKHCPVAWRASERACPCSGYGCGWTTVGIKCHKWYFTKLNIHVLRYHTYKILLWLKLLPNPKRYPSYEQFKWCARVWWFFYGLISDRQFDLVVRHPNCGVLQRSFNSKLPSGIHGNGKSSIK